MNEEVQSLKVICFPIILLLAISSAEALAGPRVDLVIGEKAPALEKLAADELASQLIRIYEADVKIASTVPANAEHIIFVGSPDTNASMKPFADSWPSGDKKLTDQGQLLRSVTHNHKPALLIGGGSPVATYWAVAEYGHHLGIRSMLFGDLDPISPPQLSLEEIDRVIEPKPRSRGWFFWHSYFQNCGAWTIEEFQRFIRQLAKLRFNEITIHVDEVLDPFVHLDYEGIHRTYFRERLDISVSGDTAGRKAFSGAKSFGRPVSIGATTYAERLTAAQTYLRTVIHTAHEFGMTVNVTFGLSSLPPEFSPLLVGVESAYSDQYSAGVTKVEGLTHSAKVTGLFRAHLRSVIETYPTIDGILVSGPWSEDSEPQLEAARQFLTAPGLLRRSDGKDIRVMRIDVVGDPIAIVTKSFGPTKDEPSFQKTEVKFAKTPGTTLPQIQPRSWNVQWLGVTKHGSQGFDVSAAHPGDCDLPAYWISRVSLGDVLSPEQACQQLLEPTCGEEVHQRVWKAFELMNNASELFEDRSVTLENFRFDLSDRLLNSDEPPPASWSEIRDKYLNAMNEMYRANTRAREGGRAFTLYFARRFEFAFEYMNCIEAVRKASIAERKEDRETQIVELEKAIESLNNALNAMAAVARSNSDRGLIAVLNEYGYRPLKKKLAEVEEAK